MKSNFDFFFHVIKVHAISWQKLKFHIHFIVLDLTWTVVLETSGHLQGKASTIYTLTRHSASHGHSKKKQAIHEWRNVKERPCNHFCSGQAILHTL